MSTKHQSLLGPTVVVSALGYFVDIYDLLLFGIVRKASLIDLGVPSDQLLDVGLFLLNMQMAGMLFGGVLWGILGDKKGRVSVLFGSILVYSLANILNGFVTSVPAYAALRLFAGIGLAGELGAAITLVSEVLSKESRGIGATIVASVGILGAVVAALIGDAFHWRTAYFIGGGLGIALIVLRLRVLESGMFHKMVHDGESRGSWWQMLLSPKHRWRYFHCIMIGIPIWFVIGILVTFGPEIARALGVIGEVKAGSCIMYAYIGLSAGDLCSGLLSQGLKSRKKSVGSFLAFCFLMVVLTLTIKQTQVWIYYLFCGLLGFGTGYWAVFMMISSEQFGTNIRATVTTTAPNFVRGSVVPITLLFREASGPLGLVHSALFVGAVCFGLAAYSLFRLKETFGKSLDYSEKFARD